MRIRGRAVAVVLLMLTLAILAGCFMPEPVPAVKLEILDWNLQPHDNMFMPLVITGHAKNVSGKTLSYVQLDGKFYDAQNVLLASWMDNMSDLPAGVTWEFNIYLMDSDVADRVDHATVEVGSCW